MEKSSHNETYMEFIHKNWFSLGCFAWVKENLLKGRSFWQIKIPQNCTWSWRKILKLKDISRNFIRYRGRGWDEYILMAGLVAS